MLLLNQCDPVGQTTHQQHVPVSTDLTTASSLEPNQHAAAKHCGRQEGGLCPEASSAIAGLKRLWLWESGRGHPYGSKIQLH